MSANVLPTSMDVVIWFSTQYSQYTFVPDCEILECSDSSGNILWTDQRVTCAGPIEPGETQRFYSMTNGSFDLAVDDVHVIVNGAIVWESRES